ncbi:hypothetical protein PFDG_05338 [Plasmodium falciparum Dd2]|uniref:Uncharacterized protein n=1 Tax=Plasmodium falciparum (isolate Dd2) TaxID=57267 RepID=A0A0L7MB49_PLAF4|nr:hypothetical protein PFDG_05338 [Plasmodium falciparum Dd2]
MRYTKLYQKENLWSIDNYIKINKDAYFTLGKKEIYKKKTYGFPIYKIYGIL